MLRITTIFAVLFMTTSVAAAPGSAPGGAIDSPAELSYLLHHYHLQPAPDQVASAMRFISDSGATRKQSSIAPLLAGFSCLFAASDVQHKREWLAVIDELDQPTRRLMTTAMQQAPAELFSATPTGPGRNDMNWACLFITGERQYFDALVAMLAHLGEREDFNLFAAASTARWSIAANARQHPHVRALVEALRNGSDPHMAELAQQMLSEPQDAAKNQFVEVIRAQQARGIWTDVRR